MRYEQQCVKLVSNRPRVVGIPYVSMESKEIPYIPSQVTIFLFSIVKGWYL
jgi:hypothetical protein